MDLERVDKKYRPVPFWSWNEKLDPEETRRQVALMDEAGIGGFFMHARGGLTTPYMGEEWFQNVEAAVDEAEKRGMHAWAYDENGWPSGFGGGIVNGLGLAYQQKYLRMSEEKPEVPEEHIIGKSGAHWFYFEVNPFYVDTLDEKVIAKFLEVAYEPYYKRMGNRIEGFFTDEPQISRNGIPWSFVFEKEFEQRYGKALNEHLEGLFLPVNDYKEIRICFWKMVTDLFSSAFFKQVYEWCHAHGMKLCGHLVLEETLESQLITNGACMPHYEYFDMPGMDWLGREIIPCLTPLQVSSVAEQTGKEDVLSETFALCGHNISFAEMKGIYEWQMVHGINHLCQHLEGYSIRGIRKRDYPPAMFYQQPWWEDYGDFLTPLSRMGMLLSQGKKEVHVLLLHPQTTAWSLFDCGENKGIEELNDAFLEQIRELERKHVVFHLGDETMIQRHGFVDGKEFCVGEQRYTTVVASCGARCLPTTEKLLKEFQDNGGVLCSVQEIPENPVCSNPEISYTRRILPEGILHYFVNTSGEEKRTEIFVSGSILDMESGQKKFLNKEYCFEPWGSLMVLEENDNFVIKKCSENVLILDFCDYYFDNVLQEKNGYILNIAERAIELERPVQIREEFHVKVEEVPKEVYLVCEVPEQYTFAVNGKEVELRDVGYFRDKSFRKLDLAGCLTEGENVITLNCSFTQSPEFYEKMRRSKIFESEKNMLAYDMEIEAIYLVGDFGVKTPGEWTKLDRHASRYHGDFILGKRPEKVAPEHIEQQGFPFFAGTMVLEKEITLPPERFVLKFKRQGVNVLKVKVGEYEKTLLTGNQMEVKEAPENVVLTLTLKNNLRNMLGPHHLKEGETYFAGPHSFYKENCVWNPEAEKDWDEDYCLVETGVEVLVTEK